MLPDKLLFFMAPYQDFSPSPILPWTNLLEGLLRHFATKEKYLEEKQMK
jgi:hypothetical protein